MKRQRILFLGAVCWCLAGPARADIASGLVAWLKMDETNGLIASDSTANGQLAGSTAAASTVLSNRHESQPQRPGYCGQPRQPC